MRLKLPIIDERRGRILAHCKLVAHFWICAVAL